MSHILCMIDVSPDLVQRYVKGRPSTTIWGNVKWPLQYKTPSCNKKRVNANLMILWLLARKRMVDQQRKK